jgi:2-polyprenyl-6-methoxyphenol hydroxylase-like FAD-dependent oxidoreductase
MHAQDAVVLGGGPAGMAAALALARDGHRVTLLERDPFPCGEPEDAVTWPRSGVAHYLQPHAFIPRGRKELREGFPDVYQGLLDAGASEIDSARKLPGERRSDDDDLRYLAVRRPVIEWALRKAVLAEAAIHVRSGMVATGVAISDARVTQVHTEDGSLPAEVVVDAMGRRSPMRTWIENNGFAPPSQERTECAVLYYCRYYRLQRGAVLPDGPWYLSPRGDLGYAGFASFPGDNGTFAALLGIPPADRDLRILRDARAFEAAVGSIPLLASWANLTLAAPITPVLPMGSLQNSRIGYDGSIQGLFAAADALCHTDPQLALGLSFSLAHGRAIARAVHEHGLRDAARAYYEEVLPEAAERYDLATAIDEARARMWAGSPVDFRHRTGDYGLFSLVAAGAVAMVDAEVFRVFLRRIGMLDRTAALDEDVPMQQRIERGFAELMSRPPSSSGPTRDGLLALCRSAAEESARPHSEA